MVGPWIHALWKRGRKLSDIEYLSIKEFGGKVRTATVQRSSTGTSATLTANAGKDMYLAGAKVAVKWNQAGTGAIARIAVDLTINGTIVETALLDSTFTSGIGLDGGNYEFVCKGLKVAATQIIKLEVSEHTTSAAEMVGNLIVFEEATGASPEV